MSEPAIDRADVASDKPKFGKTRVAIASVLCLPLLLAVLPATSLRFAGGRILDDGSFKSYATNAMNDDKVANAIGQVVGDKVLDVVDENHQKTEKQRDAVKAAAATAVLASDARSIAVDILCKTHDEFIAIAERDDLTGDETMVVDFTPLVYRAFVAVAEAEVVSFRGKFPAVDTLPDNAAMLAALSKTTGMKLGEKAGSVRVIDQKDDGSDTAFVTVHDVLNGYHNGVNAATALAVVLFLGIVFLFPRRRIGVSVASSILLVATLAPWVALGTVPSGQIDKIKNDQGRAVARAFVDPLMSDVRSRLMAVMVVSVVAILVASFWNRLTGLVGRKNAAE